MSGPAIEEQGLSPRSLWPMLSYVLAVALIFACGILVRIIGMSTDISNSSSDNDTVIYDRHGFELALFHPEMNMVPVPLESMAPIFIDAVLVSLDPDYLATDEIEVWSLMEPILSGNFIDNPASITQLYLRLEEGTPDSRKKALQEASKVIYLERTYPREALLEQYLSQVPLGRSAFGVEAGSMSWFGVSSKDLEIGQAAYLASQIETKKWASRPENSANTILAQMYAAQMVTEKEYLHHRELLSEGLRIREPLASSIKPAVSGLGLMPALEEIYAELSDNYGEEHIIKGKIGAITTVDLDLQSRVAEIADEAIVVSSARQVAVVILDDRNQLRAAYTTGDFATDDIQLGVLRRVAWSPELIDLDFLSENDEISMTQLAELHSVLAREGVRYRTGRLLQTFDTSGEQVDRFSHEVLEILDSRRTSELTEKLADLATIDQKIGPLEGQVRVKGKQGTDEEQGVAWYGGASRRFAVALWIRYPLGEVAKNSGAVTRVAASIFSELHRDE